MPRSATQKPPLLSVEDLTVAFPGPDRLALAVDGLSFHVDERETVCIVGESGCGKSLTALSILQLHPSPPAKIVRGEIWLGDRDLLKLSKKEIRKVRGMSISMIFQEPMTSLNPVLTIGDQISESLLEHETISRSKALAKACELLDLVRISDPQQCLGEYPHRLSGGMRQRVMIAIALACKPKLLIADEPTTALDVTIQMEVLDLIQALQRELSMAVIIITHDLGVVAKMAQRVIVMYAGTKVEEATTDLLFKNPLHPYTIGLFGATPGSTLISNATRLKEIPGMVPSPFSIPKCCPFSPRCSQAIEKCHQVRPPLKSGRDGRMVSCFVAEDSV